LSADEAVHARLGLGEMLVNIRTHAYAGGAGDIEIGATATPDGVTVTLTDWGSEFPDVQPEPPLHGESPVRGLALIDRAFTEVIYRRVLGRNQWVLTIWVEREPRRAPDARDSDVA
jgi:anti-sigma regulatory factor (Ser/Thr protein kinase)